jgi:hypothetical protein
LIVALRRVQAGGFAEARKEAEGVVRLEPRSWEASVAKALLEQLSKPR